jgi:hypothetical protein
MSAFGGKTDITIALRNVRLKATSDTRLRGISQSPSEVVHATARFHKVIACWRYADARGAIHHFDNAGDWLSRQKVITQRRLAPARPSRLKSIKSQRNKILVQPGGPLFDVLHNNLYGLLSR